MQCSLGRLAGHVLLPCLLLFLQESLWWSTPLRAQDSLKTTAPGNKGHVFIDLDQDGINDVFQRGLGLRRINPGSKGILLIPEPADGAVQGMHPGNRFQQGTGGAHVLLPQAIHEQLHGQWGILDHSGDGKPDTGAPEAVQLQLEALREWKETVRARIRNGEPPFEDADQDGVPDDKPPVYNWRKQQGQGPAPK